jgi:tetratricopeptide (TPR) repeat protein
VNSTYQIIRGTILLIIVIGLLGWAIVRALKRSEEPTLLLIKWILTALIVGFMAWWVKPMSGNPGDWSDIVMALVAGLILAIIWRHDIGDLIAKPFASLYDGGNAEIEPQPYYSISIANRKKGKYTEAVAEIRKQLEKFPSDFEGQMMLAEIQVENLNDLAGAELTIQRLCAQSGLPPRNIALALNALADWHLKFAQDREAARLDLQQIVDLFPETELALAAAQRIGHLAKTEMLLSPHDRQRIHVPEGVKNIGLLQSSTHLQPTASDPTKLAAEYIEHLEQHPQDTEAREKLAAIYADHYGRLDLATDQLDQLINQPNQPARLVVHWLNLLADLQLRHGAGYDTVSQTLEQIIERYPNLAGAGIARNRIDLLKLQLKAKQTNQPVKLGTYEQNIGLKRGVRTGT